MIPTVSGHWLLGSIPEIKRDFLGLLTRAAREYGDLVRIRIGPGDALLVNHPDLVERVLVSRAANYGRDLVLRRALSPIMGTALPLRDGAAWKRQRMACTPLFHRRAIERFSTTMVTMSKAVANRWRVAPGTVNLANEMSALTLAIVGETLFGSDFTKYASTIAFHEHEASRDCFAKVSMPVQIPMLVPTPANLRIKRARRVFEEVIGDAVARARRSPDEPTLAAMLVSAKGEETGAILEDKEIVDELIGFMLAGHETAAHALTWTFALLAQHPEIAEKIRAEFEAVIGERDVTQQDIPRLSETNKILNESMRLWPPAWIVSRRVIDADELNGERVRQGQVIWVSPFVLHRHPAFWPDPDRFDPERFSAGQTQLRPRHAFVPFGAGQHMCIGISFAQMEMHLVMATLFRDFDFTLAEGAEMVGVPWVTLKPRGGMPMNVSPRFRSPLRASLPQA